ncbi:MAG: TIGR00282 family metallophosphoesterase [Erysipelotrichaceae bacterium]
MKILCIGDIVGVPGREIVGELLPRLKEQYAIDMVIANGENSAHGKGITKKIYDQLIGFGIDCITMGNHTFAKDDIFKFIDDADRLIRPGNMEPLDCGECTRVFNIKNKRVAVSNLSGEVWMHNVVDSPFMMMEDILDEMDADIHIVDFHGETTSEKIAFTYYFASKLTAVVGTHTHVQTADERIEQGTAAITDLGMCGAYHSVLGRDVDEIITRFTTDEKTKFKMGCGPAIFCGAIITIDDQSNLATAIERIQIRP